MAKAKKHHIVEYLSFVSDIWIRSNNEGSQGTYTEESAARRAKYQQRTSSIGLEYRAKEKK